MHSDDDVDKEGAASSTDSNEDGKDEEEDDVGATGNDVDPVIIPSGGESDSDSDGSTSTASSVIVARLHKRRKRNDLPSKEKNDKKGKKDSAKEKTSHAIERSNKRSNETSSSSNKQKSNKKDSSKKDGSKKSSKKSKKSKQNGDGKVEKARNWCLAEKFFLLKAHLAASETSKGTDMTSDIFWNDVQSAFGSIKADCFKKYPNDKIFWEEKCDFRTLEQCKRHWSSSIRAPLQRFISLLDSDQRKNRCDGPSGGTRQDWYKKINQQFRVTATNKEGKLGGNFNLYSFDQQLWNEPIDLPKWAQEFYTKFAVVTTGADKDGDSVTASVLSKRPTGRTKTQAQTWAKEKRDLHLKPSSTTGRSSSNSGDKKLTGDDDGDKGGRPKDEFLAMLKESMKETNGVLRSFGKRDDRSGQLEVLKQCNELLKTLDKNDPENALLVKKMASRALISGMALLDDYTNATAPPPDMAPPMVQQPQLPFAQHPHPPASQPWQHQPLQSSQPLFLPQPQLPFLQAQLDPVTGYPYLRPTPDKEQDHNHQKEPTGS
jgi:hypothetical protein